MFSSISPWCKILLGLFDNILENRSMMKASFQVLIYAASYNGTTLSLIFNLSFKFLGIFSPPGTYLYVGISPKHYFMELVERLMCAVSVPKTF